MFLVEDQRYGNIYQVFTWEDPRRDGFGGSLIEDVTLDYDMEAVHRWANGDQPPEPCVGWSVVDRRHFKVFRNQQERVAAKYEWIPGTALVFGSWAEYVKLHFDPPKAEEAKDERWYDYLDKLDMASRERRQLAQPSEIREGADKDEVAEWVAKQHLVVDTAIREIMYLPTGAPQEEIQLLELNDRFAGDESDVRPVDFGLDVAGVPFRLMVADVTTDQFEQIKQARSRLPGGWQLDGSKSWRRRGA